MKTNGLPPSMHMQEPGIGEGLLLAIFCGAAYWASAYFNTHVVQAQAVYTGVALFYLPAGVKLVAIMVARYWGALGLWVANFFHTTADWPHIALDQAMLMSMVWVGTTLTVVLLWMRVTGIRTDLKNLTFTHFLGLNCMAALVHGLVFNSFMVAIGWRHASEWFNSAQAMALGDFLGSGAFMLICIGLLKMGRWAYR